MKIKEYIKVHRLFIGFIFLLACFRIYLALSGGHQFDWDEKRYLNAIRFWENAALFDFKGAIGSIFNAHGRPGYVVISLLPALIQIIIAKLGLIDVNNPQIYNIPSLFNVLATLGTTILFYHILLLVVGDKKQSLLGTVVYSLLVNSNVYIRHCVPYDYSLLLFLLAFYLILKEKLTGGINTKTAFYVGFLNSLAYLTYPAYYYFVVIIAMFVFLSAKENLKAVIYHLISFCSVVAMFELVARMASMSYFANSATLSATVTHEQQMFGDGLFNEVFIFVVRYFTQVEGVVGLVMLALFLIYVILILPYESTPIKKILYVVVIGYLLHAGIGMVSKKIVFYGRILHMYVPFIVMGAILTINRIPKRNLQQYALIVLLVVSLGSFVSFANVYTKIVYPRDLMYEHLWHIPESQIFSVLPNKRTTESDYEGYEAVVVNLMQYFEMKEEVYPVPEPKNMRLIISVPYALNFKGYQFEHYSPKWRKALDKRNYQTLIYVKE